MYYEGQLALVDTILMLPQTLRELDMEGAEQAEIDAMARHEAEEQRAAEKSGF